MATGIEHLDNSPSMQGEDEVLGKLDVQLEQLEMVQISIYIFSDKRKPIRKEPRSYERRN